MEPVHHPLHHIDDIFSFNVS